MYSLFDYLEKSFFTYSNKIAVQTEGIEYSYKKVYENSLLLSSKISSFDLIDQSRVAILLSNRNEYWEAIVGINHSNMIAVPINSNLNHIQINHIINDADIKIIITESAFKDRINKILQHKSLNIIYLDINEDNTENKLIKCTSANINSSNNLFCIIYTSGTTGEPKGVSISNNSMIMNAYAQIQVDYDNSKEIFLTSTPLYHLAALVRIISTIIISGTQIIVRKYETDLFLKTINDYNVTSTLLVPTMTLRIIEFLELRKLSLNSLKSIIHGTTAVNVHYLKKIINLINCRHYVGWGLSEGGVMLTELSPEHYLRNSERFSSVGKPTLGCSLKINYKGNSSDGEVLVKSNRMMSRYWNSKYSAISNDGWLSTGDTGYISDDGYLYITGRIKDLIIKGGVNISPLEIEKEILNNRLIKEVAVIGINDTYWGEDIALFVSAKKEINFDKFILYLKTVLNKQTFPKYIIILNELPKNDVGKINKFFLKENFNNYNYIKFDEKQN